MLSTSDLEPHERLLIFRRRSDMTQAQAADYFETTIWEYRMAEAGKVPPFAVKLGRLEPHEAAVIMRRRAGMTRKQLSAILQVSGWWLTQMERGQQNPSRLIDYWSARP